MVFRLEGQINGSAAWVRWDSGKLTTSDPMAEMRVLQRFLNNEGRPYGLQPSVSRENHIGHAVASYEIITAAFDDTPELTAGERPEYESRPGVVY